MSKIRSAFVNTVPPATASNLHFSSSPLAGWQEQDVRECVIRPLIEHLGYPPEMVTTQLSLKYQWLFLGHKKGGKKDRPLRGEADYVIDIDGRLRLVIEAKRPGEINDDDREQAYSYAMHPQVRAVMFAVISGTHFEIYHTFQSPEKGPLLAFKFDEIEQYLTRLKNLIGSEGMKLNHPELLLDVGLPLAPGLRSFAKVQQGTLSYTASNPSMGIEGLIIHFKKGSVVRREEGGMLAILTPGFPHKVVAGFSKEIDALEVEFLSDDQAISTDPASPTRFYQCREIVVNKGTQVPVLTSLGSTYEAPLSVATEANVEVLGYIIGRKFTGRLVARSFVKAAQFEVTVSADIEMELQ